MSIRFAPWPTYYRKRVLCEGLPQTGGHAQTWAVFFDTTRRLPLCARCALYAYLYASPR